MVSYLCKYLSLIGLLLQDLGITLTVILWQDTRLYIMSYVHVCIYHFLVYCFKTLGITPYSDFNTGDKVTHCELSCVCIYVHYYLW
jgi:hypothetical protein